MTHAVPWNTLVFVSASSLYSKACLNGHLYLKDNLYIKDSLLSPKLAFHAKNEPLLKEHLSIKDTFLQSLQCLWNTGFTVFGKRRDRYKRQYEDGLSHSFKMMADK